MDPIQLIVITGAAGAFFYVLKWVVDGKLHSDSEVRGLRADKAELLKSNKEMRDSQAEANKTLAQVLALVTNLPQVLETLAEIRGLIDDEEAP